MAKRRSQRIAEVGQSRATPHQDKYAQLAPRELAITEVPSSANGQPKKHFSVWRPILLNQLNLDALEYIRQSLEPVVVQSGQAEFTDPDEVKFKILGTTSIQRAMHLSKNFATDRLHAALKERLAGNAGQELSMPTFDIRAVRPNPHRPTYIHVGVNGVPHHEMNAAVETLNSIYDRGPLQKRPQASFGIGAIYDAAETPEQLTTRLEGIDFGSIVMGPIQVPDSYYPLH